MFTVTVLFTWKAVLFLFVLIGFVSANGEKGIKQTVYLTQEDGGSFMPAVLNDSGHIIYMRTLLSTYLK